MRRLLLFLLLLALLIPVHAQSSAQDACTTNLDALESAVGRSLSADCAIYTACQEAGEAYCYFRVILAAMENCEADDALCIAGAKLLGISFGLYEHPSIPDEELEFYAFDTNFELISEALWSFSQGSASTETYNQIYISNDFYHPLALAAQGIIADLMDENDLALEHFNNAISDTSFEAPLFWLRAELLLELGQTERASLDAFLFAQLVEDDAELSALADTLSSRAPLDESGFEEWSYYPVESVGVSPGGNSITDYSYLPASPLNLLFLEDAVLMEAPERFDSESSDWLVLYNNSENENHFSATLGNNYYSERAWEISLSLNENGSFNLQVFPYVFEGGTYYNGILQNPDAPDPRPQTGDFRCTATSPRTRLLAGTSLLLLDDFSSVYYSNTADIENLLMESANQITLLAGPVCINNALWYWALLPEFQVATWVLEAGETGFYAINPYFGEEWPAFCDATLRPRFMADTRGVVVADLGANNLRAEASSDSELLGEIPPNAEFTVLGGFVCAEGLAWWQVDYEGTIGWTAEGQNGVYWIEPSQNQE